jgi:hypothetical protein
VGSNSSTTRSTPLTRSRTSMLSGEMMTFSTISSTIRLGGVPNSVAGLNWWTGIIVQPNAGLAVDAVHG